MMAETQHFCLRWNNYQSSITSAFENLRDDEDFVDVTLACDGKSLKAHRVVLSACSPYFRELLKSTPCKHPVIVLQDVAFADLHALVEFIYHGEVNVHQRNLTSFLKTAEVLRVSGLTQQVDDRDEIPVPPHGILPRNTLHHSLVDDALFSSPQSPPVYSTPPGATVNQLLRRAAALAGGGNFHRRERRISPEHHVDSSAEQNKRARTSESTESTSSSALPAPTDFSASSFPSNKPLHQPSVKQESEGNNGDRESSPSPNDRGVLDGVKTEPVERCGSGGDMENSTDSVEATDNVRHSQAEQEDHDSVQGQPPPYLSPAESKLFGSITSSGTFNFSMAALAAEPFTGLANQTLLGNSDISAGTSSQGSVKKVFTCQRCGKVLCSKASLKRHVADKHAERQEEYRCVICERVYCSRNSLMTHIYTYHKTRPGEVDIKFY